MGFLGGFRGDLATRALNTAWRQASTIPPSIRHLIQSPLRIKDSATPILISFQTIPGHAATRQPNIDGQISKHVTNALATIMHATLSPQSTYLIDSQAHGPPMDFW